MSSPTTTARPGLAGMLDEFDLEANRAGFVGTRVLPVTEVKLQIANIGRVKLASLLKNATTTRASGAGYNQTTFEFEDWSYATKDHGQVIPIDDRIRSAFLSSFDAEAHGIRMARNIVLQAHEDRVIATLTDPTIFSDEEAMNWESIDIADPVADVIAAVKRVRNQSGLMANAVVLDWETYSIAKTCESVIERLKHAGFDDPKKFSEQAMAALFEVDQVIVSGAMKNINVNTLHPEPILKPSWPRNVVGVGRVATTQNVQEPCVGRTFHWSADGSKIGTTIDLWESVEKRATMVRSRIETDEKLIHPEAWTLITGTYRMK